MQDKRRAQEASRFGHIHQDVGVLHQDVRVPQQAKGPQAYMYAEVSALSSWHVAVTDAAVAEAACMVTAAMTDCLLPCSDTLSVALLRLQLATQLSSG